MFALVPESVFAHAFGQQYTLPLPVTFYITGGVVALVTSFIIFGLFGSQSVEAKKPFEKTIAFSKEVEFVVALLQGLSLLVFLSALAIGVFGQTGYSVNPVPILFWIVLMLGLTYATVAVDGLWDLVNPFRMLSTLFVPVEQKGYFSYPRGASSWSALFFYLILVWVELVSGGIGAEPHALAFGLIGYLCLCVFGSLLVGSETWYGKIDLFTTYFRLVGKFAPIRITAHSIMLRLPGSRLVSEKLPSVSALIFVLFMLSSTAFDGFKETKIWLNVIIGHIFSPGAYLLLNTVALVLSPLLFFVCYAASVWLMKVISCTSVSFKELLLRFGPSLLPIAIVYSFAHYFTLLYMQGMGLLYELSDPLRYVLVLFGDNNYYYQKSPTILAADTVWYIQLAAIVIGHVVATYIAHRIAVRTFDIKKQLLLSQIPMLFLMVLYTCFGLWLLSLPFGS